MTRYDARTLLIEILEEAIKETEYLNELLDDMTKFLENRKKPLYSN